MDAWSTKKLPGDDHWSDDERKQLEFCFSQRAWRSRNDDADPRIAYAVQRGFAQAQGHFRNEIRQLRRMIAGARIVGINPGDEAYFGEPDGQIAYTIEFPPEEPVVVGLDRAAS